MTGGFAAPLLFAVGTSTLMYSAFQPCQDLDWSSFALEGTIGAVTSLATMGLGGAAEGARTIIKSVESTAGRQALHFALNGATSLGGRLAGAGARVACAFDRSFLPFFISVCLSFVLSCVLRCFFQIFLRFALFF